MDPTAALVGELHGLQRLRGGSWEGAAREALSLVEMAVAADTADEDLRSALEPLKRELGVR